MPQQFTMPYVVMPLRITAGDGAFKVSYVLPTVWSVSPFALLPILGLCALFYFHGPVFGSWWASAALIGVGFLAGGLTVVLIIRLAAPLKSERVRLVYHVDEEMLELPAHHVTIPRKDIRGIAVLHGWYRSGSRCSLTAELSILHGRAENVIRSAVFLAPKSRTVRVAQTLSSLTDIEYSVSKVL